MSAIWCLRLLRLSIGWIFAFLDIDQLVKGKDSFISAVKTLENITLEPDDAGLLYSNCSVTLDMYYSEFNYAQNVVGKINGLMTLAIIMLVGSVLIEFFTICWAQY